MGFRTAFLNLEQNHKRWPLRRDLIVEQLAEIAPDLFAMNEICIPDETGRWLQRMANERLNMGFALVQQSKTNSASRIEGEGLLSRFRIIETANLDYRTKDFVALVARVEVDQLPVDVYVTHLYRSRGKDALRLHQVEQLLEWIESRSDAHARIVCGDFNAPLELESAKLMATKFRPTQTDPTAFTPLTDEDGSVSHPYWQRFDRCIDYIWVDQALTVQASGVTFDRPAANDPSLWPSDHAGVWADLDFKEDVG